MPFDHPLPLSPRVLRTRALSRAALHAYLDQCWSLTEWLFSGIATDAAYYEAPDPLRRPLIFYLGHSAAFYVNKLRLAGFQDAAAGLDERLDVLFERGVDPAEASELESDQAWPTVARTRRYRAEARALVERVIDGLPEGAPITPRDPTWALLMAFEHDLIHFETSSMLIRQYAPQKVRCPAGFRYDDLDAAPPAKGDDLLFVPAGRTVIGRADESETFGWDNEFGRREAEVPAFEVARDLVSHRAFAAFVEAGGYQRRAFWTDEGWAWRAECDVRHPKFWVPAEGRFRYRAMFDVVDMPWAWPVEVNCHEAQAYLAWLGEGARLPTEAEWCRLRDLDAQANPDALAPEGAGYRLHVDTCSPRPVGQRTAAGLSDVRGNVWQWLADDFHPLPGFETHPYYDDFSEPYFDEAHAMLRGGSWATAGAGATVEYRLWFRRHFFQHAGFRYVRDVS